jgi:dTDP-glucose pyrophosphorylase
MKDWKKTLVGPSATIRETIKKLDKNNLQIILVTDQERKLLGTVTDGDIRRGILKGLSLDEPVNKVMFKKPTEATLQQSPKSIFSLMRENTLRHIPLLDEERRVVGLKTLMEFIDEAKKDNWVVLMAGGLGTRLGVMTKNCPKPLLKVGNKPILEVILESYIEYGFYKFFISVNYLSEKICDYFGDGSKWGIEIQYLKEEKRLGTAGALSLLPATTTKPLFVMNGDLLTKVNFRNLLDFHAENNAFGTMCIRECDFEVPYGVVHTQDHHILKIDEKPVQRFYVNAGIYVLDPEALKYIPKDRFFDMPVLFEKMIADKHETIVFPIREYWLDIGRVEDFQKAKGEFHDMF